MRQESGGGLALAEPATTAPVTGLQTISPAAMAGPKAPPS